MLKLILVICLLTGCQVKQSSDVMQQQINIAVAEKSEK
jgi:hypothetical protein